MAEPARFTPGITPLGEVAKDPRYCQFHLVPQRQSVQPAPDEILVRVTGVDINAMDHLTTVADKPKPLGTGRPTLTAAKGLGKGNRLSLD
mmetsp:Transcript_104674/g.312656  ORF Transcript_104674/g.312656 Transcript_104674/m.312656 type:complete len:90 (+) Transcript_104674:54-323(+)